MTETGHGSNVHALRHDRHLRATARFVIHTPDDDARKDYIGNAARDGRMAVVFAQLITRRRGAAACTRCWCRSATSAATRCPASGWRTAAPSSASTASTTAGSGSTTCGSRARTCSTATRTVAADGTYFSPIENPTKRFFTMLGTLIQGRVSVSGASIARPRSR